MFQDQSATWEITDGTIVYGIGGTRLGTVRNYDPQAGYLDIQKGWLFPRDFYVPLAAVDVVTGEGINLRLTRDELEDDRYISPPDFSGSQYGEGFGVTETTPPTGKSLLIEEREDVTVVYATDDRPIE